MEDQGSTSADPKLWAEIVRVEERQSSVTLWFMIQLKRGMSDARDRNRGRTRCDE